MSKNVEEFLVGEPKYSPGDIVVLKREALGFGVRPVAEILEFKPGQDEYGGHYEVHMEKDDRFFRGLTPEAVEALWNNKPEWIPTNAERISKQETHFQWNMEYFFDRAPQGTLLSDAVELYSYVPVVSVEKNVEVKQSII